MTKPLKVLIVEDSANDAELIAFELRQHGYQPTYERVATAADMLAALARQIWEVVISDYIIPDFGGKAALEICQLHGLDIPFICVSGIIDEGGAVEMIRAGAHDFVSKLHLSQLGATVERELQAAQRRAELRQEHYNKAHLAAIVENSSDAIIGINLEGVVLSWNRGAEMIYGYAAGEMIGQSVDLIMPPNLLGELAGILERIRRGERIEGH